MTVRVGINGFGRIGRNYFRALTAVGADIELVAANDLGDTTMMAHLLKYDSILGRFPGDVVPPATASAPVARPSRSLPSVIRRTCRGAISVWTSSSSRPVSSPRAPMRRKHVAAGAKKVIISAPASDEDITIVLGVNDDAYDPSKHTIISNASCTTNCLGPLAKVLNDSFVIKHGLMTTVHAYTGDQNLLDAPHKDLRRARAAALEHRPHLDRCREGDRAGASRAQGQARRLRAARTRPTGSATDLTVTVEREATVESVKAAYKTAADGPLKGYLTYTEDPIVSTDIVTDPASCIFDSGLTKVIGDQIKVIGWYDNEWGYSNRLVDLTLLVGSSL